MHECDVVIVGGGLVGASLANVLAQQCPALNLAVVEAFEHSGNYHPSFDDRSIALAADSAAYLSQFGLFQQSVDYASAIEQVYVSDRGHIGKTHISHQDYGLDALGHVVEVRPWGFALNDKLTRTDVKRFCPAKVTGCKPVPQANVLTLDSGEQIRAKLVVVADGAQSPTRSLMHFDFTSRAYEQHALIANVGVSTGHQHQAFERFTQHGPLALLPMSGNRYSLVWCDAPERLHALAQLNEQDFLSALQQEFGYRAGLFTQVGERPVYPLSLGRVKQLCAHHSVVIGNAAHAIHPIAGQGFNLGLRDIKALVSLLAQTPKENIGTVQFTHAYQDARKKDIDTVMMLTDSLVRLFSNQSRTLALGRTMGLSAMHLCETLRQPLAKQLMGFN